jgi:opacity protein-like surface antigen
MRLSYRWWAAALLVLAGIEPVAAQERRPERPYRGLFAVGSDNSEQLLAATVSVSGAYDENLLADRLGFRPSVLRNPNAGRAGWLGIGSGALSYHFDGDRLNITSTAATSAREYQSSPGRLLWRHDADADVSLRVVSGLTVGMAGGYHPYNNQLASLFTPLSLAGPLFGEPPDLDLLAPQQHHLAYTGTAAYTYQLSRRNSASVNYAYHDSEIPRLARHFNSHAAGAGLTFGVARGVALHLGYGYRAALHPSGEGARAESHTLDLGVDYNRPLSFSRRTMLMLSTGAVGTENRNARHYRLVGVGGLRHEIGQTWEASVAYDRNTRFLEIWADPVVSDSLTFGLGGFVSRRMEIHFGARGAEGDIGFGAFPRHFTAANGTANLSYALTRNLRFGVDYVYSQYRFGSGIALPPEWLNDIKRQRVSVSLSAWMPLIQSRRADVTR